MNKALIAERFSKAIGTYAQKADIQQQIAEKMTCLLQQHLPATPFNKVVEFGCGTGNYSRLLYHTLQPKQFFLNDLWPAATICSIKVPYSSPEMPKHSTSPKIRNC